MIFLKKNFVLDRSKIAMAIKTRLDIGRSILELATTTCSAGLRKSVIQRRPFAKNFAIASSEKMIIAKANRNRRGN